MIDSRLGQVMAQLKEDIRIPIIVELATAPTPAAVQELTGAGLRATTTSKISPLVYGTATSNIIQAINANPIVTKVFYDEPLYPALALPFGLEVERQEVVPLGESVGATGAPELWDQGITGAGVKVGVIDSVPAHSPIIIKKNDIIDIIPISELDNFKTHTIAENGEEVALCDNVQIFTRLSNPDSGKYWTDIKYVIRHKYNGKLLKINTQGGLIDVSPNHSLIGVGGCYGKNGFGGLGGNNIINATDVSIGTRLAMPQISKGIEEKMFTGSEGLAWLYGFFVAEGSAPVMKSGQKPVNIHNKNMDLLHKAKRIFETNFHGSGDMKNGGMTFYYADDCNKIQKSNKYIYKFFRKMFFTVDGEKRVPTCILNAPKNIKLEFLRGYNDGDGCNYDRLNWEFQNFTTISQTLAMGLVWLIKTTTHQEINVHIRSDKLNAIQINLNKPDSKAKIKPRNAIKKILEYDYDGYIYDVETSDHTFCSGIGPVKTHNTGTSQSHEMISPGLKDTFSAVPGESVEDENSHGAWCCSAAAGRPVSTEHGELVGAAPGADLYALKALSDKGTGQMSWVMQCIEKATLDFKCDVISMSLGSLFDNGGLDPVSKLVNDVVQKYNILCVVAAGNSFIPLSIGSPGGAIAAVTVGSYALRLPLAGTPSSFESKGPTTSLVLKPDTSAPGGNILAPGVSEMILAAGAHGSYQSMAGTSMATPQAAGALALLRQAKPDLSRAEVEQLLAISSFPVPKDTLRGYGPIRADTMYRNLGKATLPITELQAPLNVIQSAIYAPFTLIPRPENERLKTVRLPAIMGG